MLLIAVLFWAFETFSRKRHLFRFLACVCDWNSVFFRALYRILCQLLKSLLHFSEKFINLCSAMLLIAVLFWAFETFSRKMHLFRFLACVCDWNCVFFRATYRILCQLLKSLLHFSEIRISNVSENLRPVTSMEDSSCSQTSVLSCTSSTSVQNVGFPCEYLFYHSSEMNENDGLFFLAPGICSPRILI